MQQQPENRNYSSISPSAKTLLLMKGHTEIPFARQAAAIISLPEPFLPDYERRDFGFWARVTHFESRYQSIDQLLQGLDITNILEMSSGFSFRGLYAVQHDNIHYIDTDLPEIATQKAQMAQELAGTDIPQKGQLEILPLNALDADQFHAVINRFSAGPLAIVNEGLLMYLNKEEKRKLCALIREALQQHDGYWITADVYIRNEQLQETLRFDDELQHLLDEHNIEANKFASMQEAEDFFNEEGFTIDREADPEYEKMSSIKYFMQLLSPEQLAGAGNVGRIQATWRLKLK